MSDTLEKRTEASPKNGLWCNESNELAIHYSYCSAKHYEEARWTQPFRRTQFEKR